MNIGVVKFIRLLKCNAIFYSQINDPFYSVILSVKNVMKYTTSLQRACFLLFSAVLNWFDQNFDGGESSIYMPRSHVYSFFPLLFSEIQDFVEFDQNFDGDRMKISIFCMIFQKKFAEIPLETPFKASQNVDKTIFAW